MATSRPIPTSLPTGTGSTPAPPTGTCPQVVDRLAGLAFDCLVGAMQVTTVAAFSTVCLAQTESAPDWYMSQLAAQVSISGRTLKSVAAAALTQLSRDYYPANSVVKTVSDRHKTVSGRPAVYLDARIRTDKTQLPFKNLRAVRDRVVIVAVARRDGTASELVMAVPDTERRVWPRMDVVAGRLKLV